MRALDPRTRTSISVLAAALAGLGIGLMDSRPGWDDTGVTVVAVLAISGLAGLFAPAPWWVSAAAVGGFVPLFEITRPGGASSLAALAIAVMGAGGGRLLRRVTVETSPG